MIIQSEMILLYRQKGNVMKNTDRELEKFRLAYKEADGIYAAFARESGLAVMEYWVIWMVSEGVRTQAEISDTLFISKQTVNSALRRLEADGIVYLEAVDGKAKNVCLTERGKEFAAGTAMRIIGVENEIFSSWDERDVEAYINLTERFLLSLKEKFAEL